MLTEGQRAQVDALLDQLLDFAPADRLVRLSQLSIADPAVRAEADSLLRAAHSAGDFLSAPAHPAVELHDDAMPAGTRLGPWRITRRIGRGGMGEVYEAERADGGFEQRVAIKLMQPEAGEELARFQAERQILARLEHPGIARLYDGGVSGDGRPYMVMEFVEGVPITRYCSAVHASLAERLRLFAQVCDAVAYAHRNLIVHRDLKPSNILVTSDGQAKLLDFGIAKLMGARNPELTQVHAPLTPMFAAPEQLTGTPVTTATDVYQLGLLLFELLTGRHAWPQNTAPMLHAMRAALQRSAPVPSRIAVGEADPPVAARSIAGDLDAIVAKALREEPGHRYGTVEALRADIGRYRNGEPVDARAGARLYVLGRLVRRYRWAAASLFLIFVSLAGGLSVAAWQAHRAELERDIARRDAAREEAVRYNLTNLFRQAIEDRGKEPATAKNMIDLSAQRVLREYRDQPRLAGELVLTLADLYGALEDVEGAGVLLEGFVAQAGPDTDAAALADARQKLANIELLRGHTTRSAGLLDAAQSFWAAAPQQYREERLEGLKVRAQLQRAQGDLATSIATTREAIAQRTALSGHDHRETAVLYNSLAITLASAGELQQALAAYQETMNIYRAIGLEDGLDAQIIRANYGTLQLRAGHPDQAGTLLKTAIDRERALAGDSAAVAAALGYYGRVRMLQHQEKEAVTLLEEASRLAAQYAGPTSPVGVQNRLFLGDAQLAAGNPESARATLVAAHEAALGQYGASHPLTLRAQIALAQVAAATGHPQDAIAALDPVIEALRKVGPPGAAYLSQAEELRGRAQAAVTRHSAP